MKDAQVAIDVDNCVPDFENLSRIREKGTRVASSGRLKCSHAAPASLLWHNLFLWLDFNSFFCRQVSNVFVILIKHFLWSDKQFFEVLLLLRDGVQKIKWIFFMTFDIRHRTSGYSLSPEDGQKTRLSESSTVDVNSSKINFFLDHLP